MIGQRLLFSAASFFLLTIPTFADPPKPSIEKIDESIRNLGSSGFATRQRAAEDLIRAGQPALSALKAAAASPDEEVRRRAESIVRLIEAKLQNEALIRAPKIRLKYNALPLSDALADLNRKTGLNYALDQLAITNAKQPLTLDTGDVPFWEAVEKFMAAAGLAENLDPPPPAQEPQVYGGRVRRVQMQPQVRQNAQILLGKPKAPLLPADTSTLVRVRMLPASALGSGVTKGTNQIHFMLDITPAPSMTWQGVANVDIFRAVDERGTSLAQCYLRSDSGNDLANANDPFGNVFVGNGQMIINGNVVFNDVAATQAAANPRHVRVTLFGKENSPKTLKELTGVVSGRLRSPPATLLTVDNVLTVSLKDTLEAGEHQIRFTERQTEKAGYVHVHFTVSSSVQDDLLNPWNANGGVIIINGNVFRGGGGGMMGGFNDGENGAQPTFTFQDATGRTINNVTINMTEQTGNGEVLVTEYLAVIPTRGYKCDSIKFLAGGRKTMTATVPFILKNVPLP